MTQKENPAKAGFSANVYCFILHILMRFWALHAAVLHHLAAAAGAHLISNSHRLALLATLPGWLAAPAGAGSLHAAHFC